MDPVIAHFSSSNRTFIPSTVVNYLDEIVEKNIAGKLFINVLIGGELKSIEVLRPSEVSSESLHAYTCIHCCDFNNQSLIGYIHIQTAIKILILNEKLFVEACRGNLDKLFHVSRFTNLSNARDVEIETSYRQHLLYFMATKYKINFYDLKKCLDWCEKNADRMEQSLRAVKIKNPFHDYCVFRKRETDCAFNMEYRGPHDVRLRFASDKCKGSSAWLSYHIDLYVGDHFFKVKYWFKEALNPRAYIDAPKRKISPQAFLRHIHIINHIADIEGVVKFVRRPEILRKELGMGVLYKGYVYQEIIHGLNLLESIKNVGSEFLNLQVKEKYRIMREIFSAALKLHERGVIHRDLKLDNIMIYSDKGNHIKIIDFEMANILGKSQHTSNGTLGYIDPVLIFKHFRGIQETQVDEKSDIYSLGVTLYVYFMYNFLTLSTHIRNKNDGIVVKNNYIYDISTIRQMLFHDLEKLQNSYPELSVVTGRMLDPLGVNRISLKEVVEYFDKLIS